MKITYIIFLIVLLLNSVSSFAQDSELKEQLESLKKDNQNLEHRLDILEKNIDDVLWYERIGDAGFVDKVFLTGPPLAKIDNPTGQGAGNPVKFWSYVFIPKGIDLDKKYPLIVLPHGGVHAFFSTYHTHIIKELLAQGYIIIAADYRGSTGYGKSFYEKIRSWRT